MKHGIALLVISALGFGMLNGCGSNEQQQREAEQARQDSLREVREQRMAQQRKDSLARAEADSLENQQSNNSDRQSQQEQRMDVSFDQDGDFAIQVEAWRSERKAQSQVEKWVNRGFENAFVVQYGNEQSGDIWYRVRLGRLASQQSAKQLQSRIKDNYGSSSWISTVE